MKKTKQIKRIQEIINNPLLKTCDKCGFVYMPLSDITEKFCPRCEDDLIDESLEQFNTPLMDYEIEEMILDEIEKKIAY